MVRIFGNCKTRICPIGSLAQAADRAWTREKPKIFGRPMSTAGERGEACMHAGLNRSICKLHIAKIKMQLSENLRLSEILRLAIVKLQIRQKCKCRKICHCRSEKCKHIALNKNGIVGKFAIVGKLYSACRESAILFFRRIGLSRCH